jgi:hypothetical protein
MLVLHLFVFSIYILFFYLFSSEDLMLQLATWLSHKTRTLGTSVLVQVIVGRCGILSLGLQSQFNALRCHQCHRLLFVLLI